MEKNSRHTKGIGINGKLIGFLLPTIILVFALLLAVIYTSTTRIVMSKSEELLQSNSETVVRSVESWMNEVLAALNTEKDAMEFFQAGRNLELEYIKHTAGKYDAFPSGIYIGTVDGALVHSSFVPGPEYSFFEKSWYQDGLKSPNFVFGDVYLDENTQGYVVGASSLIKDRNGNPRGVAAADIYLDAISSIVKEVKLEQTGSMFLVEKNTDMIIGHKDDALLGTVLSEQKAPIYPFVSKLIQGEKKGLQTFQDAGGDDMYLYLSDIPDSTWAAVAYVPRSEIMASVRSLVTNLVTIFVISVLALFFMILILIRGIVIKPVREFSFVASQIADGKLDQSIKFSSRDEFGELAQNFNKTVSRLRDYVNYIDEISKVLDQVAAGDLMFELTYDYAGEFEKIKNSLEYISTSLNQTLGQIGEAADQVAAGSEQVSSGAQALSQGATEQASAVEELAATINEISNQVSDNAGSAREANEKMEVLGQEIGQSNSQMQQMIAAMREISDSSGQIEAIIKTIEDISFQTNLLALNAAVEAARAGAAGKGFAVVADEVRNLASKSAEAAKNTTSLIQSSIDAVKRGTKLADETAQSLEAVVSEARSVVQVVEKISEASKQQADSIVQVTQGVDQIASVVQTNSATAEESAAASEELSGQAHVMKELVGQFRLRHSMEEMS